MSTRTNPKNATSQTPFSLVFGAEAVIPAEVLIPTVRYGILTIEDNNAILKQDLDTIDELRDIA